MATLIHTVPVVSSSKNRAENILLEPWMEAKLLAVTEIERTPNKKHAPKSANYGWQPLRRSADHARYGNEAGRSLPHGVGACQVGQGG